MVRPVECGHELFEQSPRAMRGVGLEHYPDVAFGNSSRRLQHGRDLRRVMSVVVDEPDTARATASFEPSPRTFEAWQRCRRDAQSHAEVIRDGDRRGDITRIV